MKELSLNNCRLDKRYDIGESLGRGSYAEIFLAKDTLASPQSPHGIVVIKALNVFLQDDLDADLERTLVENFQNEAVALDRVRHPNIISRIGHGTARDLRGTVFHYLVLEYMSGGDLQTLVRKTGVSLSQAMSYIEQICSGLGHAHQRAIIHRDIKPQNLLLSSDLSTVKIADFGVARVTTADSPITRVGTNVYAPPEHSPLMAGKTGTLAFSRLMPAADIYSLAKTVYTVLTGESPRGYANQTIIGLPANAEREDWSGELTRVLLRATDSDPRRRHQSVDEFWADLAGIRDMASDGEFSTVVNSPRLPPQPHVARGYTPFAPVQPSFERIVERVPALSRQPIRSQPAYQPPVAVPAIRPEYLDQAAVKGALAAKAPEKRRRVMRRLAAFLLIVGIFTGILYGAATYFRSLNLVSQIRNSFVAQTGVVNSNVKLRSEPNTDNDPIGVLSKNSKVRIVNSQNNWYQVDIVEQGRIRPVSVTARRGWIPGKYVDVSDN
jgi:serine/threonine protein kinase